MKRTTPPHPQTQRRDFEAIDIDTGRTGHALSGNAIFRQYVDNGLLDPVNELAHANTPATDIDQRISDDLSGTVISHLAAPVNLDYRDMARGQYMLRLAGLALGEDRRMLHKPELIEGIGGAGIR